VIFTRRRLPPEMRPPLDPDERVVAWATVAEDAAPIGEDAAPTGPAAVIATNLGLYLPGRTDRLGWHEIHKATWTGRQLVVTAATVVAQRSGYAVVADTAPMAVTLPEPGGLPHEVRTRVTRSVSFTSHQSVPGGAVRVVARRVPGVDGLRWTVRPDEGTDPATAEVERATAALVALCAAALDDPSL
jgi:hypothetical protein